MPQNDTPKPVAKSITLIIGLIILGIAIFAQRFSLTRMLSVQIPAADRPDERLSEAPKSQFVEPGEWLTFASENGDFTIAYPPNWDVSLQDTDEGGSNIYFKLKNPTENQHLITVGVGVTPVASATTLGQVKQINPPKMG